MLNQAINESGVGRVPVLRPALALATLASLWIAGWLLLGLAVLHWWSQVQWAGRRGAIVVWVVPAPPPSSVAYLEAPAR